MFLGASGLHIAKQIGPLSLYGGMNIRSDDPSKLYGNCGVFMNSTDHAVKHMMTFGGIITRPLVIQSIVRTRTECGGVPGHGSFLCGKGRREEYSNSAR